MKPFVLLIVLLCMFPAPVRGAAVHFRSEAVVSGPMLTLGDVAEVEPRLSGTPLFAAPAPGETVRLKSGTVKAYVLDAVSEPVEFSGAEVISVRHEGSRVGSEDLRSIIDSRLRGALAHLSARDVRFETRTPIDSVSLPPGQTAYEVIFSDRDILSSRQVAVIIRVDGRAVKNLTIPGRVQALVPVVTAAGELNRGTVIGEEHIVMREKNIAGLRNPCLDKDKVIGTRLKRPVAPNHILTENDIDLPLLVKRRQVVTMVLQEGPLRISARGVAGSDGRKGDVIMVENIRSRKEIPCEVIGPGLARVEF